MDGTKKSAIVAAAVAGTLALAGCGGGRGAGPAAPVGSTAGARASLLARVPADAGLVMHLAPGLLERAPDTLAEMVNTGLRDDLARGEVDEPIARALIREIVAAEGGFARVLGWRPGESEVVVWAEGLTLVIRVRLDGRVLRASLERAERVSGRRLPRQRADDGGEYAVWDGDDGRRTFARVSDDELVVVVASEGGLETLARDALPARRFDPGPVLAQVFPDAPDARFAMMLDPRWVLAVAEAEARRDDGDDDDPACDRALMQTLAGLPRVHAGWRATKEDIELVTAVALAPATAERLRGGLAPIPYWPVSDDLAVIGFGLSFATAAEVGLGWLDELELTVRACGGSRDELAAVRAIADMPPITGIRRGAAALDVANDAVAIAAEPTDLASYWRALRAILPLRPQPPAAGERLALPGGLLTSDGRALMVTQGRPIDEAPLAALRDAPSGPTAIFAMTMGVGTMRAFAARDRAEGDDTAALERMMRWISRVSFEVGLRERYLTARAILRRR